LLLRVRGVGAWGVLGARKGKKGMPAWHGGRWDLNSTGKRVLIIEKRRICFWGKRMVRGGGGGEVSTLFNKKMG